MTWAALTLFAIALAVAAITPGPGILAIVARALADGFWQTVPMALGLMTGDIIFLALAIFGLAFVAELLGGLFLGVKLAGAAYLIYLGWRMWRAPATAGMADPAHGVGRSPLRGYLGGLAVTLGNPKTIVFYLALLPSLIDLHAVTGLGFLALTLVAVVVLATVLAGYIALAARARRLLTTAAAMRRLNRGAGTVLIGAGVGVAAS